jgi:hypothetical protein
LTQPIAPGQTPHQNLEKPRSPYIQDRAANRRRSGTASGDSFAELARGLIYWKLTPRRLRSARWFARVRVMAAGHPNSGGTGI